LLPGIYASSKIPATNEKVSPPNIEKLCAEFFKRLPEKGKKKTKTKMEDDRIYFLPTS
jgi:hypothetical protein